MNQSLLRRLLARWPAGHSIRSDCFASAVRAGNELPIPAPLLVDVNLCAVHSERESQALLCEAERKLNLLAADRHFQSVLCTVGVVTEQSGPLRLNTAAALWERLNQHDGATPRMLLALEMGGSDAWHADVKLGPCREVAVILEIDQPAARMRQCLFELRRSLRAGGGDTRLLVLPTRPVGSSGALPTDHDRLSCIAEHADTIMLNLLFAAAPVAGSNRASDYACVSAAFGGLGLRRIAPCVFSRDVLRADAREPAGLVALLPGLPLLDVIGLGPGAVSQIGAVRFDNCAEPSTYCRDLALGGFGIATASQLSPVELMTADLLCRLHSGLAVDPIALCAHYDGHLAVRSSVSLLAVLAMLHRDGMLQANTDGAYALAPAQDHHLGEVSARLRCWSAREADGVVALPSR